ncbi:MAG: protein-export chaperone SecB, partial [Pseudomonadales bacterium]
MSEQDDQSPEQPVTVPADGGDTSAQVRLERLYLKDSSFESPNSPGVFREQWQPEIELEINNRSHKVAEDRYEVILTATVKARQAGERTAFIVEIQQAAVFHMTGLDDQVTHRVLG